MRFIGRKKYLEDLESLMRLCRRANSLANDLWHGMLGLGTREKPSLSHYEVSFNNVTEFWRESFVTLLTKSK